MELYNLSEEKILKKIACNKGIFHSLLSFLLDTAYPSPYEKLTEPIYYRFNILRNELGLLPNKKPGDIDILIIPQENRLPLFEKLMVAEIKIVRPKLNNPERNANKYGLSQVKGLIEDGFPFVGLIHIIITEKSPKELHWKLPVFKESELTPDFDLTKATRFTKIDPFPIIAVKKQYGRLRHLGIPSYVGFSSFSVSATENELRLDSFSPGYNKIGGKNPSYRKDLIDLIRLHFNNLKFNVLDFFSEQK